MKHNERPSASHTLKESLELFLISYYTRWPKNGTLNAKIIEEVARSMTQTHYGAYQAGQLIAGGSHAAIYAIQNSDNLVLKILAETLTEDGDFNRRFIAWLDLVVQLEHPHILSPENYGIEGTQAYIVLPKKSQTLQERLKNQAPLSTEESLRIIGAIADALSFIHEQAMVHGDVKPSNILLDRDGTAYLADFEMRRLLEETYELLGESISFGTAPYRAPEQERGQNLPFSDTYALAAIAFYCLSGEVYQPDQPAAASTINPELALEVDAVLQQGLQPVYARRQNSPSVFFEALKRALLGEEQMVAEAEQSHSAPQVKRGIAFYLRRLGCGILLTLWFMLMLWPCVMIQVLVEGEFVVNLSDRPGHEARIFTTQNEDQRGFGFSFASINSENDERLCIQTNVRYLMWQGENEPVDYCRCYDRVEDRWQTAPAVDSKCRPLPEESTLVISNPLLRGD